MDIILKFIESETNLFSIKMDYLYTVEVILHWSPYIAYVPLFFKFCPTTSFIMGEIWTPLFWENFTSLPNYVNNGHPSLSHKSKNVRRVWFKEIFEQNSNEGLKYS